MSKKGENIRKRKDGRWEGRYKKCYKENGKILYGSIYGKTYREVKEKLHTAYLTPIINKTTKNPEKMSFSELLLLWQESNKIRLKGGTKNKYSNLINSQIIPKLGHFVVSEITATKINSFLGELIVSGRLDGKGGLSPSYIRTISFIITSAINFGVSENICQPLKNKINKPSIPKHELFILTNEAQKKLELYILNNISPTGVGIMISLYTGLRLGEVCALSWDDIDLLNGIIFVRHTVSRITATDGNTKTKLILDEPKTCSSKRMVPIPSPLLTLLLDYRLKAKSLFVVSDGESFISPRTFDSRFHRILSKIQIANINFHILRHTFATRCIELGVDVKSLSEILGHADVSITLNTYVHSSFERKKSQLEKITSFIL